VLKPLLIISFLLLNLIFKAQSDSVMVTEQVGFKEGIYLTHQDFRKNNPITKEQIKTKLDKEQLDFYFKAASNEKLEYTIGAETYSISTKNIWGLEQNKTLFVNFNGAFFRVPVFGAISYFAGVVEVTGYYTGVYDPMFGMGGSRTVKTKELNEFIMNYYDGKVLSFSINELDMMLSKDADVYKQFKSISRRKRKKQATRFIRMYNQNHPVYYLKK